MNMNMMNMNMMNMNNMMMNNMMNDMNMLNIGNRINIVFKAITGITYTLAVERGITISDMFKEYLIRIDKERLFENNNNAIEFIYNGRAINFKNNNQKVEEFFGSGSRFEIQIVTNDLLGA